MDNKAVFSQNLKEFMFKSDKTRKEVSEAHEVRNQDNRQNLIITIKEGAIRHPLIIR